MNASAFAAAFGQIAHCPAPDGTTLHRSTAASASGVAPQRDTHSTTATDHMAMLTRYRADPVAFRRAMAGRAHAARNQAMRSVFARMLAML